MGGHQDHRANSSTNNVNQECDHLDVILEGLGLHQIEEHMEYLESTGHQALHQEMESSFGYDCCKQCGLGITDSYGMFKKWCYYVPPIYDEEQEVHEGLHQVVGCHDATTGDFCGHLVAHHDLALFDATPFQVVSHDADGSHQRGNSFDYDCCNQYGHGNIDSYGVFK
jgi:hypothetical protein